MTTVREMDGFAWLLRTRDRIAANRLLAPSLYVSGHILNAYPMGMYATVVTEPEQAREVVREQAAAGYDFIKIHNRLSVPVYEAVLDEARRVGLDVVGHVPHEIRVEQAIRMGQRTLEHFKGYIQDWDLQLTPDDYVAATRGAEVWNCPTFYTYRSHLRGDEAKRLVAESPEMRYVSRRDRRQWIETAAEEPSAIHQNILELSKQIFRDLLPVGARFLAGTDSGGGYPFMVPGFALHEELGIMEDLGMSPYRALETATVNAAEAMRKTDDLGSIAVGRRADLVLLRENPLETVRNLATIDGVMVRGIWLTRSDLDQILEAVEEIFNPEPGSVAARPPTVAELVGLAEELEALAAEGCILRDHDLERLIEVLGDTGNARQAAALRRHLSASGQ